MSCRRTPFRLRHDTVRAATAPKEHRGAWGEGVGSDDGRPSADCGCPPLPIPTSVWPALQRVLGADLLARLLSISVVSVRRYSSGARRMPDDVAARLHALSLMVDDLGGAYNDAGIRRWLIRPRTALGNRAPVDMLTPDWRPDDPNPRLVRSLANALAPSPLS